MNEHNIMKLNDDNYILKVFGITERWTIWNWRKIERHTHRTLNGTVKPKWKCFEWKSEKFLFGNKSLKWELIRLLHFAQKPNSTKNSKVKMNWMWEWEWERKRENENEANIFIIFRELDLYAVYLNFVLFFWNGLAFGWE